MGGSPNKYNKNRPKELMDYCMRMVKSGQVPTIVGFACSIPVARSTVYKWGNDNPEFKEVMEVVESQQLKALIERGLDNEGSMAFLIFMLKNCHGWTDRVEQKVNQTVTLEDLVGDSMKDED